MWYLNKWQITCYKSALFLESIHMGLETRIINLKCGLSSCNFCISCRDNQGMNNLNFHSYYCCTGYQRSYCCFRMTDYLDCNSHQDILLLCHLQHLLHLFLWHLGKLWESKSYMSISSCYFSIPIQWIINLGELNCWIIHTVSIVGWAAYSSSSTCRMDVSITLSNKLWALTFWYLMKIQDIITWPWYPHILNLIVKLLKTYDFNLNLKSGQLFLLPSKIELLIE